jgi:hypothetical protein
MNTPYRRFVPDIYERIAISIVREWRHVSDRLQLVELACPPDRPLQLATGTGSINLRNVPHARIKIVGDKSLKLVTVHVVDKGAPLYDVPPR